MVAAFDLVAIDSPDPDRLLDRGARLVSTPRTEPFGAIANLVDPDGNAFNLCAYGHHSDDPQH